MFSVLSVIKKEIHEISRIQDKRDKKYSGEKPGYFFIKKIILEQSQLFLSVLLKTLDWKFCFFLQVGVT